MFTTDGCRERPGHIHHQGDRAMGIGIGTLLLIVVIILILT